MGVMKPKNRWLLLFGLLLCAALDQTAATAAEVVVKRESIPWSLRQVGPAQRSLDVIFRTGGCKRNPRGIATESGGAVRISVTVEVVSGPHIVCRLDALLWLNFPVQLKAPLAGKPVLGSRHFNVLPTRHFFSRPRVPRLVGLAPKDAAWIVRAAGLRERIIERNGDVPRPVVRAEYPAAGAAFPADKMLDIKVLRPPARRAR